MSDTNNAVQQPRQELESGEGSIPIQLMCIEPVRHKENSEKYARAEAENRHEDCAMCLREMIHEEPNPLIIKCIGAQLEQVINRLPYGRRNIIMSRRLSHEQLQPGKTVPDPNPGYQQKSTKHRRWWWSRSPART